MDSFGALAFVTVELRASRVSPVVKEGASLQGRLGGFSASLSGRLDRFSAAGLQGWTAFQQLAFRPLCKQFRAAFFLHVAHALAQFFLKLCNGFRFRFEQECMRSSEFYNFVQFRARVLEIVVAGAPSL